MSMKKKGEENKVEKILMVSFGLVSAITLLLGAIFFVSAEKYKSSAVPVRGEVLPSNLGYDICVGYHYNGNYYENVISGSSSEIHVGDEVVLYVSPEDPYTVKMDMFLYLAPTILLCLSAPFLIVVIVFGAIVYRKESNKKYLLANGKRIYAKVTGGRMNIHYSMNGRHPFQIECEYVDPAFGAIYLFASDNVWTDPHRYVGQDILVYVNPEDWSKYYVDVDSLKETGEVTVYDYR